MWGLKLDFFWRRVFYAPTFFFVCLKFLKIIFLHFLPFYLERGGGRREGGGKRRRERRRKDRGEEVE
jgi:hypothetical protein